MANYISNTPGEVKEMLSAIGAASTDDLFREIPEPLRLVRPLNLPPGMSEPEVRNKLSDLAGRNMTVEECTCFLGGGAYDHHIPTVINHILLRGDFFTAYTPYQAEISQGTLQSIYEYQSLICGLTGMDVSNASMYEGGTALAEAIHMAMLQTGRTGVVMADTVHPEYRKVVSSLINSLGAEVSSLPVEDGVADLSRAGDSIKSDTAALVVQYPNFFGGIEDLEVLSGLAKVAGAMLIVSTNPIALGLLTPPGEMGADIVTGEGQSLGIPLGFGGPYLGFIATREPLLRKIPGRIAGATVDKNGKRGFVLTLQAREQHIRREKAGSNICSNQALMALNAAIHLCLLGREGLREVASQCFQKAHYLKKEFSKNPGILFPYSAPFFHEFVIQIPRARKTLDKLLSKGILGGLPLEDWYPGLKDYVLVSVTEKRTKPEMDTYAELLGGMVQ